MTIPTEVDIIVVGGGSCGYGTTLLLLKNDIDELQLRGGGPASQSGPQTPCDVD